jgi:hypothetical protein
LNLLNAANIIILLLIISLINFFLTIHKKSTTTSIDSTKNKPTIRSDVLIPALKDHPFSIAVYEENEADIDEQVDSNDEDNALYNNQKALIIDEDKENRKSFPIGILFSSDTLF